MRLSLLGFEYNGLGHQRTIKKTVADGYAGDFGYGQSQVYLYGLNGELLAEIEPTGKVVKEYIYMESKPPAMLEHRPDSGEPFLNADLDNDGSISVEDFLIYYFNYSKSTDPAYDVNGDGIKDNTDYQTVVNCGLNPGTCEAASYKTQLYYIHNDDLGTPKLMTDINGTSVWEAYATPFGDASVNEDVDGDGGKVVMNIRQPGQYFDWESGFYYNYFRYYDPETGRYITSDPIGLNGGINTYAYVENNPLKYTDPKGLAIGGTIACVALTALDVGITGYAAYQSQQKAKKIQKEIDSLSCDTESIANNADRIRELEAQLRKIGLDLAVTVGSGTFGFGAMVGIACPYLIASPF